MRIGGSVNPWTLLTAHQPLDVVGSKFVLAGTDVFLHRVLELRDAQHELLSRLQSDVTALTEGPFHAGLKHVEDGLADHRTPDQRRASIEKARDRFIDAHAALRGDLAWRSLAGVHVAICSLVLGDLASARTELADAYDAAVEHLEGISVVKQMPKAMVNPLGAALAAAPTLGIANHLVEKRARARARRKLVAAGSYVLGLRAFRLALGASEDELPEHLIVGWEQDHISKWFEVGARRVEGGRLDTEGTALSIHARLPAWRLDGSPTGWQVDCGELVERPGGELGPPYPE